MYLFYAILNIQGKYIQIHYSYMTAIFNDFQFQSLYFLFQLNSPVVFQPIIKGGQLERNLMDKQNIELPTELISYSLYAFFLPLAAKHQPLSQSNTECVMQTSRKDVIDFTV